MNKSLLSLKKTLLTLMLMASGSALMAQLQPCYLTATLRSLNSGATLPNRVMYAKLITNSPVLSQQYAATTNQNGVAQFQLPFVANSANHSAWEIGTLFQTDSVFLDTVDFPSQGFQTAKTFYLNDVVASCNPVVTATSIQGTTLWRISADTANFRQCFGYGNISYYLFVDNQFVDSNWVSPSGINNANVFTTALSQGTHTICMMVFNPMPTGSQGCVTVTVGGGQVQNFIMGAVRADGDLHHGDVLVELFGLSQGQLVFRTDTLHWPIDSATYYFANVAAGQYYTRATPLDPNYISTYSQSSLTWEDANVIQMPGLTMPPYEVHDIDLISFWDSSTVVTGTVQGLVSGIGTNVTNNMPGGGTVTSTFTAGRANVFIQDAQGHVVGHATLNADGTFFMDGLPIGDYTVVIDHPFVDAASRPVNFTSTNTVVNVQATVTSAGLNMVTGNKKALQNAGINLFPNPAQNRIFIQNFEKIKSLNLVNVLGVSTTVVPSASLMLDNQTPGIYFLQGQTTDGESFNLRLIKQ